MADENYPAEGIRVIAEEFPVGGVVYDMDGVRVTAFEVDHGDLIKAACGYRIDYNGRSVVISGDTRFNRNVVKYGTGADLLIHEVAAVRPELLKDAQVQRVMAHHSSPQEAGRVFHLARPKLAVYTHLVLLARPGVPAVTAEELVAQTRAAYDGPLVVDEDLHSIGLMEGVADLYMPDFKLWAAERARRYLLAPDYPEAARQAIQAMHAQVGELRVKEDGLAVRGLLVRHLVMPGLLDDTREIVRWIAALSTDTYVNVMHQYYPAWKAKTDEKYRDINRAVDPGEMGSAYAATRAAGLWRLDRRWRPSGYRLLSRLGL
jgi:hypothetical protein